MRAETTSCVVEKHCAPTKEINVGTCRDCCDNYRDFNDYNFKREFLAREFLRSNRPKVTEQL